VSGIVLEHVRKVFSGGVVAVADVSVEIAEGEFLVLVGPWGCGKSTLLRMIAGLEEVSGGAISIDGRDVTDLPPRARDIAMVFQTYALYPHMTVRQNLGYGLKVRKTDKQDAARRVHEVAAMLGLEALLDRRPAALSGGQRQRVAIARALAVEPSVILCDEPISMLDVSIRIGILNLILQLKRESRIAFLYITHDIASARYVADEVLVMYRGRIVEQGPTDAVLQDPQHAYTRLLLSAVPNPESGLRLEPLVRGVLDEDAPTRLVELEPGHLVRRPA
jgi:ABC-type sugar transport system ATPase subunit